MKNNRPELGTISRRVCPECRKLMSGSTWDILHLEQEHGYEEVASPKGDEANWKQEKFMSVPDILDWINKNHSNCECMKELVELLEYSLSMDEAEND